MRDGELDGDSDCCEGAFETDGECDVLGERLGYNDGEPEGL